ncbi:TetR family transcriptional regulator [Saccharothrix luteola]|uniref:TetR family transcriptional regulator n=1 Tax=Saccharothrix luteola TaxID=2893018 RepID=UPI001E53A06C|nr:TetR family transcriptional regulator [Saccharothrix luteola]MCC8246644.1 TetR family transcriptional regulator [Saccharothrix luteola]
MARAALSADAVVDVALRLVDEEGAAALTLAAVASRAGVATPSLYKHVRNLAELRALMSVRIMDDLAVRIGGAVLGRRRSARS